jgi:hypothetical protein
MMVSGHWRQRLRDSKTGLERTTEKVLIYHLKIMQTNPQIQRLISPCIMGPVSVLLMRCLDVDNMITSFADTHKQTVELSDGSVHVNPGGLPISGADDTYHVAIVDTNHAVSTDAVTVHAISANDN